MMMSLALFQAKVNSSRAGAEFSGQATKQNTDCLSGAVSLLALDYFLCGGSGKLITLKMLSSDKYCYRSMIMSI